MILPPFFGHKTPANDGEPYRLHYSYLSKDIFSYDIYNPNVSKHTFIAADILSYKIKFLPPLIIHTYLSQDVFTYKIRTEPLVLTYLSLDCLSYSRKYPPKAPYNIFGIPIYDSETYLTWTAPESYQLPIIDYIVQYSLANPYSILTENNSILRSENEEPITLENAQPFSENWVLFEHNRSYQTNISVTGLTNNNSYSFKVAAVNSVGTGDYGYSNVVALQFDSSIVPGAPSGLLIIENSNQLVLSWMAPAPNNGPKITNHIIEYTESGGAILTQSTNSSGLSYSLNNLTNNTMYTVRVAAVNSAGTGLFSSSSSGTPSKPIITITQQPIINESIFPPDVRVIATANKGAILSYQWEKRAYNVGTWTTIDGETGSTLVVSLEEMCSQYRVVVSATDGADSVTSNATQYFGDRCP